MSRSSDAPGYEARPDPAPRGGGNGPDGWSYSISVKEMPICLCSLPNEFLFIGHLISSYVSTTLAAAVHLCRRRSHDPNPTIRPPFAARGLRSNTLASVRALITRRLPTSNTSTRRRRRLPFIFRPPPCLPGPSKQTYSQGPASSPAIHSLVRPPG